jgi:hypothetical protein
MNENDILLDENEALGDIEAEESIEFEDVPEVDEVEFLRQEIDALKKELQKRDELEREQSRMNKEILEFKGYFPEVDIHSVPNDIWERVREGSSLSAAYALMLRKNELEQKKIGDFNEKNRRMSAGSLINGDGENYYSPAEVKRMTPAQVRMDYDDIMASMKHWN